MKENLSEDKIQEFKEAFEIFDQDKNGYISVNELREILNNLGQNPNDKELDEIINEADSDGDGNIDFKEFLCFMAKRMRDTDTEDELIEAFKLFDNDGNGVVSVSKLKEVFYSLNDERISLEEIDLMIGLADLDNDGFINYEELIKMVMNR